MITNLLKTINKVKSINDIAFKIGLKTKTPLDKDVVFKGLTSLSREFLELTESDYNKEKNEFILKNTEQKIENQKFFRVENFQILSLSWGSEANIDFNTDSKKLFSIMEKKFEILPVNISYIEFALIIWYEWKGHQYQKIMDTFYKETPLYNIFDFENVLQNDIYLRGKVDDDRIAVISLVSSQSDSEIHSKEYTENSVKAYCGIAQTKNILITGELPNLFLKHSEKCINFINNNFIQSIITPLNDKLLKR